MSGYILAMSTNQNWHGTTIVLIRKGNQTIVAGCGQVSLGNTVLKSKAKKVRKIESRGVIAGFAGSTADALTLFEEYIIEVHISNIHKRESFRHNSYVSQKSTAVIAGFGVDGYKIALEKMINLCSN